MRGNKPIYTGQEMMVAIGLIIVLCLYIAMKVPS